MRLIHMLISLSALLAGSAHAAPEPFVAQFVRIYEKTALLPAEKTAECAQFLRGALEHIEIASLPQSLRPVNQLLHDRGCLDKYSSLGSVFDVAEGVLPEGVSIKVVGDALFVRIESFQKGARVLFDQAFKRLPIEWRRRASLVMLDLRGNKGGSVEDLRDILDRYFAPAPGARFMMVDATAVWPSAQITTRRGALAGLPVAILVDKETASAAEWMAASLRYELAKSTSIIIGERTYGKAVIQCLRPELFGGKQLLIKATCGEWSVRGKRVNGIGLTPDIQLTDACMQDEQCLRQRLIGDHR